MPFRPAIRWSPGRSRSKAFADDLHRLCADPRVHRLFGWFGHHEREIADLQLAITAIPSPSFCEQARAAWLREQLQPLGLALSTDAAGNLLAFRPGLDPGAQRSQVSAATEAARNAYSKTLGHAFSLLNAATFDAATSNTAATRRGAESGAPSSPPAIAISAHLDTVFPAATVLNVRREQTRLLGPGISDNGAGLAALWALAAAFHQLGIVTARPLLFIANVGEEGEGNLCGVRHLYREQLHDEDNPAPAESAPASPAPRISMLIALDGAGTANIVSQALGSRRYEIAISGPGGHSWSDHGVPNPLVAASLAVAALFRIELPSRPRTTLNVGSIEGGTSINAIPSRAVVKVDLRSSHPGHLQQIEQQLRRAVAQACAEAQAHSAAALGRLQHSVTLIGSRPAGELSASSPLLAAIRAVDAQLGIQSQTQIASTDANIPLSLGLEAVSLGAGGAGGGAHTMDEWFDPEGRELALQRLSLLILLFAGLPEAEAGLPE